MSEENANQSENNINYRILTSRSARQLRMPLNPIFNILGASSDENGQSRTYADIVRNSLNLNELRFSNNVVPRRRVRDALYNILEEVENIRDHISEHIYLKLTNDLRTIYDYITQNDPVTDESFIQTEEMAQAPVQPEAQVQAPEENEEAELQASAELPANAQPMPVEDAKTNPQTETQASITLTARIQSIDDRLAGMDLGMVRLFRVLARSLIQLYEQESRPNSADSGMELTSYQKFAIRIYAGIKWMVTRAPVRQLWQILALSLWLIFVFVFGIIHIIVAFCERITSTALKKIVLFGILILEEILRTEQAVTANLQLGILYIVLAECLSICRQRIAHVL